MKLLRNIIAPFAYGEIRGGGEYGFTPEQIQALKAELKKQKSRYTYILIGLVVLMVVTLAKIIFSSVDIKTLNDFLGKTGLFGAILVGIFTGAFQVWRLISYLNVLLMFTDSMDEATLKAIIMEFYKKL